MKGFPAWAGCNCSRISVPTCWSEAEPGARKGKVVTTAAVPAWKMSGASAVATSPASPNTQRIVKFKRPVYMWIFLIQVFIARFSVPEGKTTMFVLQDDGDQQPACTSKEIFRRNTSRRALHNKKPEHSSST